MTPTAQIPAPRTDLKGRGPGARHVRTGQGMAMRLVRDMPHG